MCGLAKLLGAPESSLTLTLLPVTPLSKTTLLPTAVLPAALLVPQLAAAAMADTMVVLFATLRARGAGVPASDISKWISSSGATPVISLMADPRPSANAKRNM